MTPDVKYPSIKVRLGPKNGPDGNAFVILGAVKGAMKSAGLPDEEIEKWHADATSDDYDHLCAVCHEWVDLKFGYRR